MKMYKISIVSRKKQGNTIFELKFKDRDLCELAYLEMYLHRGALSLQTKIIMYCNQKEIKSFLY